MSLTDEGMSRDSVVVQSNAGLNLKDDGISSLTRSGPPPPPPPPPGDSGSSPPSPPDGEGLQSTTINSTPPRGFAISLPLLNALLARPAPVHLGKLSYVWYLTHWPIFVFFKFVYGFDRLEKKLIAVFVSYYLAVFIFKFVETPVRARKVERGKVFLVSLVSMALLQGVLFYLGRSDWSGWGGARGNNSGFLATTESGGTGSGASNSGGAASAAAQADSSAPAERQGGKPGVSGGKLESFVGKHIVIIGDSLQEYLYLNLVYQLTHGVPPPFDFYHSATAKVGSWPLEADGFLQDLFGPELDLEASGWNTTSGRGGGTTTAIPDWARGRYYDRATIIMHDHHARSSCCIHPPPPNTL